MVENNWKKNSLKRDSKFCLVSSESKIFPTAYLVTNYYTRNTIKMDTLAYITVAPLRIDLNVKPKIGFRESARTIPHEKYRPDCLESTVLPKLLNF